MIGFFQKKNKTPLGKEFAPRRYIYPVSFRGLLTNWDVSIKKKKKKKGKELIDFYKYQM